MTRERRRHIIRRKKLAEGRQDERTPKCEFPISGVEPFVEGKSNVVRQGDSVLGVDKQTLPDGQQIVVLDYLP